MKITRVSADSDGESDYCVIKSECVFLFLLHSSSTPQPQGATTQHSAWPE